MTKDELVDAFEGVIRDWLSSESNMDMPVIEDWAVVCTANDLNADDDDSGKWFYMRGKKQPVHRTIGLLQITSDQLRGVVDYD